ncbi:hypothetical protein ACFQFG_06695 [Methylobacterium persicinum]
MFKTQAASRVVKAGNPEIDASALPVVARFASIVPPTPRSRLVLSRNQLEKLDPSWIRSSLKSTL